MQKLIFPLKRLTEGGYSGVDKYTPRPGSFTLFFSEDDNGKILAKVKKSDGSIEDLSAANSYPSTPDEPQVAVQNKEIFNLTKTDDSIIIDKDNVPVAIQFAGRLYGVYCNSLSQSTDGNSWVIPVDPILAEANIPDAEGEWVIWYASTSIGGSGGPGPQGPAGKDGKTYIPSISDGMLSFTVDGVDSGIAPVEVVGPEGPAGKDGVDGEEGKAGVDGKTYIPSISDGILSFTVDGVDSGIAPVEVVGPKGDKGDGLKIDAFGPLTDLSKYSTEPSGFAYYATDAGSIYFKVSDEDGAWSEPSKIEGTPGATFIPTISGGMLSWENDGGLDNPPPVKVVPKRGVDYWTAKDRDLIYQQCLDMIFTENIPSDSPEDPEDPNNQ